MVSYIDVRIKYCGIVDVLSCSWCCLFYNFTQHNFVNCTLLLLYIIMILREDAGSLNVFL